MSEIKPDRHENGIWYAVGTFDGKRIRRSLKTRDEQTAKEQCALYEARLWKRRPYGEEAVRTFEEAAASYLQQGGEGRFLAPVLKHFKGRPLAKIAPGDVREMAISFIPEASNATRNRQGDRPGQRRHQPRHSRAVGASRSGSNSSKSEVAQAQACDGRLAAARSMEQCDQ